jgi:hypothetical protein
MSEPNANINDISMGNLIEQVLVFRSPTYIDSFCEKLLGEGISSPADLLLCSKEALEKKLTEHASFNYIEMADTLSLRSAMDSSAKGKRQSPERRRSRSHDNRRGRGRNRDDDRRGFRNNSRPQRDHGRDSHSCGPRYNFRPPKQAKPELWAAVEKGDEALVRQLLNSGHDPEEKYSGWSPLMKAAEEGHTEIAKMLLDKNVDMEVKNKKGRTALSFAAAPSMKRKTPVETLRLLLQRNANANAECIRRLTPKQYALEEKRDDAIEIFEEFEKQGRAS